MFFSTKIQINQKTKPKHTMYSVIYMYLPKWKMDNPVNICICASVCIYICIYIYIYQSIHIAEKAGQLNKKNISIN